jgi:hypothetical protein
MNSYRISTMVTRSFLALALVATAASVAKADSTVTDTSNVIANTTLVSTSPTMGTLAVSQFNNTSGTYAGDTLNWIDVTLYGVGGSVVFNYELFNPNSLSGGNLTVSTFTTNTTLKVVGASSPISLSLSGTYSASGTITDTTVGTEFFTPGVLLSSGNVSSGNLSDPTDLTNFTGTGVVDFTLTGHAPVSSDVDVTNGYTAAVGGSTDAGGYVTVEYDYSTPPPPPPTGVTPEPGTLGLFGTGLVGFAGLFRRKFLGR